MAFLTDLYTRARTGVNNLVDDNSFSNEGVAIRDRERDLAKCKLITTQESIAKFDELKTKHSNDVVERERKKKQKEEDERKKKEEERAKKDAIAQQKEEARLNSMFKSPPTKQATSDTSVPAG